MPKIRLALCAPPEPRRRNGGLLLRVGRGEEGPTSKGGREERGTEREEKGIPQSQGEWNNLQLWITRETEREGKGIPQSQGEWNNLQLWITEETEREGKGIPQSQGEWNNLELWITEKGVADDVEVVTCVKLGHVKLKAPRQTIDAVQHETEPVRRRTPQHTHTLAAR